MSQSLVSEIPTAPEQQEAADFFSPTANEIGSTPPPGRAAKILSSLALSGLIAAVGVLSNLRYEYAEVNLVHYGNFDLPASASTMSSTRLWKSGYPYLVSYELRVRDKIRRSGDLPEDQPTPGTLLREDFHSTALVANIFLWAVLCVGGGMLVYLRPAPGTSPWKRRVADGLMASVIVAIPASFVGYHTWRQSRQTELIDRVRQQGICATSAYVPVVVADQLPLGITKLLQRLREVALIRPEPELLADVMSRPTLVRLTLQAPRNINRIRWDEYDGRLTNVILFGTRVDHDIQELLRRNRQLLELSIIACRFDPNGLDTVMEIPHLRSLNLRSSQVDISRIRKPAWEQNLLDLVLPVGQAAGESFVADGMVSLQRLSLLQKDQRTRPWPTRVQLRNLDALEKITIDSQRLIRLRAENLPRLTRIESRNTSDALSDRISDAGQMVRFAGLELSQCPSLHRLDVMATRTRDLDISKAGGLRHLVIGSYRMSRLGQAYRTPIQIQRSQAFLKQVGQSESLREVRFIGVTLSDCDLSDLGKNKKLRKIWFNGCRLDAANLRQMGTMPALTLVDLGDGMLRDEDLVELKRLMPRLTDLSADMSEVRELRIGNDSPLNRLQSPPFDAIESFELLGESRLEFGMNLGPNLRHLRIDAAPRLRGLAILGPVPADVAMGAFRDLKYFEVGGPEIDDRILASLRDCVEIERLMLAYTHISQPTLEWIGTLEELRSLSLPGSPLTDSLVEGWSGLRSLWNLDIADTQVDLSAVQLARRNESLRFLCLDRVSLSDAAKNELGKLDQVTHLSIEDQRFTDDQIDAICALPLDYLNLSGCALTPAQWDRVCAVSSPRLVVLRNNDLPIESLARGLCENPSLMVDVEAQKAKRIRGLDIEADGNLASDLDVSWRSHVFSRGPIHSLADAKRRPTLSRMRLGLSADRPKAIRVGGGNQFAQGNGVTQRDATDPAADNSVAGDAAMNRGDSPTADSPDDILRPARSSRMAEEFLGGDPTPYRTRKRAAEKNPAK
ncbi:MAG: hypothetical protein AAF958_02960 [Planctomycetota bacterium]